MTLFLIKVGDSCVVTSEVSKQPPVSMLTSTITAPFFMCSTIVSVTTTGQRSLPRMAPIATSHLRNAFNNDLGCMVEVNIL